MDKSIYLLKKRIENRDNTIDWLNQIIDAKEERNNELQEEVDYWKSKCDFLIKLSRTKLLKEKEWLYKREEVFEHKDKKCAICGRTDNIDVHHLVYRKGHLTWEYKWTDLIPLCRDCHKDVHKDVCHKFYPRYEENKHYKSIPK